MITPQPRFYDDAKRLFLQVQQARHANGKHFRSADLWQVLRPALLELSSEYETAEDTFERFHEGVLVAELLTRSLHTIQDPGIKAKVLNSFATLPRELRETVFGKPIDTSNDADFLRVLRALEIELRTRTVTVIAPATLHPEVRRTARKWCEKLCLICDQHAAASYQTLAAALYELRSALALYLWDESRPLCG